MDLRNLLPIVFSKPHVTKYLRKNIFFKMVHLEEKIKNIKSHDKLNRGDSFVRSLEDFYASICVQRKD